MPRKLKAFVFIFFTLFFITAILATLIETHIWDVTKIMRSNIIKIHVSFSVIICIFAGYLFETHITKSIKYSKPYQTKKRLGLLSAAIFIVLVITSICIRHTQDSELKTTFVILHWAMGLVTIMVYILHFTIRKKLDILKQKDPK